MMVRIAAVTAAVAAAAVVGATVFLTQTSNADPFHACRASAVAGGAGAIGGPFTLVNGRGETVTDAEVITQPSLIYFGYTFCPDVCPLDTVRNADAVDVLAEAGHAVTPVFISVDPARDTPDVMADYAFNIHDRMIALTGSPEQIKSAAGAYRAYYRAQDGDPDYYLVDHSTFTYLVMPDHGFVEFFRRDLSAEALAEQVGCFVDAV